MLIIRIIAVIFLLLIVFVAPWWLVALFLIAAIAAFPSFYEAVTLAFIADLFYDHLYFSGAYFIPVFALCAGVAVFIGERVRKFFI